MTAPQSLDDKRVAIVNEHMRLENAFAVYHKQILFARLPNPATPNYVPAHWEFGVVIGVNFALALLEWITIRQYSDSLLAAAGVHEKVTAAHY